MTTTPDLAIPNKPLVSTRLHGLDALRAAALLLGIVVHALVPFLPDAGWLVSDRYRSEGALAVVYVIHLFRMALFMMLAGFFGRMVLLRRGARAYLKDRTLRIGLPAVAFWPIAVGSLALIAAAAGTLDGSGAVEPPAGIPAPWSWLMPGHLWFLVTLLQCAVITVVARAAVRRVLGPGRCDRAAARIGAVLASPVGVVVAAVPYWVGLLVQGPAGHTGIQEPPTIVPVPGALIAYLGAFLFGWFLRSRVDATPRGSGSDRLGGGWPVLLVVAAALSVVGWLDAGSLLPEVAGAAVIALAGWSWTLGLLGLALRLLRRDRPAVRYLADASYWLYLMHLPLLLLLELALRDLTWPILIKLMISGTCCILVLLISYDLLVRPSWLGRWLNGHRHASVLRDRINPGGRLRRTGSRNR